MESILKVPIYEDEVLQERSKNFSVVPFDKICRTCLSVDEQFSNIFDVIYQDARLSEIFATYIAVQVERNDKLPQNICNSCLAALVQVHNFIHQCEYADALLRAELTKRSKLVLQIKEKLSRLTKDVHKYSQSKICEATPGESAEVDILHEDNKNENSFLKVEQISNQEESNLVKVTSSIVADNDLDPETDIKMKDFIINDIDLSKCVRECNSEIEIKEEHTSEGNDLLSTLDPLEPLKGYHIDKSYNCIFLCRRCDKSFSTFVELQAHKKNTKHTLEKKHLCTKCNKQFSSYYKVQLHMKNCATVSWQVTDDEDNPCKVLKTVMQLNKFSFTVYSCRRCYKFYACHNELQMHRKKVIHNHTCRYTCPKCGKIITSIQHIKEHMKTHVEDELSSLNLYTCIQDKQHIPTDICDPNVPEPDIANSLIISALVQYDDASKLLKKLLESDKCANTFFSCKYCKRFFATYSELVTHQKQPGHVQQHYRKCPECNKQFYRSNSLKQHLRIHSKEKPFCCQVCGLHFSFKNNLQRHMMIHTGERPHVCEFCGKGYIQADSLKEHRRVEHTGETPFLCNYCGERFIRRLAYQAHISKHHIENKKLQNETENKSKTSEKGSTIFCKICKRYFKTTLGLTRHMVRHQGKTFLCSYCGKSFITKAGLLSHVKVHTGAKPYHCGVCYRRFSQRGSLKVHLRVHTGEKPYVCKLCLKAFKQRNHLIYHMRIHSKEKPYKCLYCNKCFSLKSSLTVHQRIHTGETPFVCNLCNKGFYHSTNLKKHKMSHEKASKNVNRAYELSSQKESKN